MLINDRDYTTKHNLKDELSFDSNLNYLFHLDYLTTLSVSGNEPLQYLQGQLTSDISKVTADNVQPGAICNIKGRILTLLNIFFWENYHLLVPKDMATKIQKTLYKTAMFSRVNIKPSSEFTVFGFYLQSQNATIPLNIQLPENIYSVTSSENYLCYKVAEELYMLIVKNAYANQLLTEFPATQQHGELAWHSLTLSASIFEIYPNSTALFLPHRLNLQKSDYINFNKGCFVGQEIIARTHYRAKLKHGMFLYKTQTTEKLYAGQKIYNPEDSKELGELVDIAILDDNTHLLATSLLLEHPTILKFADIEKPVELTCYK